MFCPKCGAEYVDGITACADCSEELVLELAPEKGNEYIDYVELITTYNHGDIAFIKSVFDTENITYFFDGEYFHQAGPLALPVRLLVDNNQVEEAKKLLSELNIL